MIVNIFLLIILIIISIIIIPPPSLSWSSPSSSKFHTIHFTVRLLEQLFAWRVLCSTSYRLYSQALLCGPALPAVLRRHGSSDTFTLNWPFPLRFNVTLHEVPSVLVNATITLS